MNAAVQPARFAPNPHRRAMIAKIHVAQKQLAMNQDDYEQLLFDAGGATSCSDLDDRGLARVLDRMKKLGFRPLPPKGRKGATRPADHPMARKARALWISLHHLGVVDNPSEKALETFARRQLRCAKLQWADQSQGYKLVEALKAMAEKAGWSQDVGTSSGPNAIRKLQLNLADRMLALLVEKAIASPDWSHAQAGWSLAGMELPGHIGSWSTEQMTEFSRAMGKKLREART